MIKKILKQKGEKWMSANRKYQGNKFCFHLKDDEFFIVLFFTIEIGSHFSEEKCFLRCQKEHVRIPEMPGGRISVHEITHLSGVIFFIALHRQLEINENVFV